jgi:hypothetical protein
MTRSLDRGLLKWRFPIFLLACLLTVLGLPARAEAPANRIESQNYISHGLLIGGHGNLAGQRHHLTLPEDSTPITFDPKPGDRLVNIEVMDQSGRWAAVLVHQEAPGKHHADDLEFCAPSRYIPLDNSRPLEIRVYSGLCHNHEYGVATSGTITATFSR